jgi:hypothetical protein
MMAVILCTYVVYMYIHICTYADVYTTPIINLPTRKISRNDARHNLEVSYLEQAICTANLETALPYLEVTKEQATQYHHSRGGYRRLMASNPLVSVLITVDSVSPLL